MPEGKKIVATNRRALHDFFVTDRFEAGLELRGTEVKSVRAGQVSLSDSYAEPERGEMFLVNSHIAPYEKGSWLNHEPKRRRKLLLHRREIDKLAARVNERGFTLIPLSVYFKNGKAKVEIGLCKGKKQYDKREDVKKREQERDIERAMKH